MCPGFELIHFKIIISNIYAWYDITKKQQLDSEIKGERERGTATVRPRKMSRDATRFVLGRFLSESGSSSETLRLCSPLISAIL